MNICIVDDDKFVVEKIVEGVSWECVGISGVFTANTSRQAREILETADIDILLTDIEMPQGSGLELLEWLREKGMTTECIFLSSYAHFSYAQKAIQLQSAEYLLKPVSNRELEQILLKVAEQIRKRLGMAKGPEEIRRQKEQFWKAAVSNEIWNGSYPEEQGIADREGVLYQLGMLRFYPETVQKTPQDKEMAFLGLRNRLEKILAERNWVLDTLLKQEDNLYLIVFHKKEYGPDSPVLLADLRGLLQETFKAALCIYLVDACGIKTLGSCSRELLVLEREAVPGPDRVFREDGSRLNTVYTPPRFDWWEQEMGRTGDLMAVAASIGNYIEDLWQKERIHVSVFKKFRKDLQQMLYHYMGENTISITQLFDGEEFDYYSNKAIASVADMKEFLQLMFKKLQAVRQAEQSGQDVVEQIVQYIENHLGEDLSRGRLAAMAFLSEDYLSKKFTAFTGNSIPNFVAARRMDRARQYLKETNLSVSQIAMEVGYTNFSYFSKTFRDYAGCTPNAYRSKNNKNLIN